ncbi:acyl-CoA dehydrogenase [Plantactinospora sp. KLBMP9567]|uniref:acyl-CoA dehydrogenase family protein n=1 Tax=Plantactinospora sp. KLBMP9567 TaxID=3085900 RepID=UPI0029824A85|nr:acyl-CoA dehydrogenase [Plantactinospora sp. KLBMP9567]MDW5324837.1 acyl-CoA dehydrogenase [Plantactinospora sp. KLBMP9567]
MRPTDRLSAWQRLAPAGSADSAPLAAVEDHLDTPSTVEALDRAESNADYPQRILDELRDRGLARLFAPAEATPLHLGALGAVTARRSGSLAITVGVNGLALLPVYLAGSPAQQEYVTARLAEGAAAALLLTEWEHGSNLLRNQATARRDGDGYRLDGTKHLINGGSRHELLVALLRTGDAGSRPGPGVRDFSLFLVERDASVTALPRRRTLPARAADISGVRFTGTRVPTSALIGVPGEGFAIVQKTLMVSRGGVAALASGAVSGAWDIAVGYARRRDVYGAPIDTLGAIGEHLVRLAALDTVVAAMAVKAACAANLFGPGAGYFAAVAKLVCCRLAEEAVTEGRYVLGARALLEELPYARFVRDVLLYGVFDGTSHLMLDDLADRLPRFATSTPSGRTLERTRQVYRTGPRPTAETARLPWRRYAPALAGRCADLHTASGCARAHRLARAADGLSATVRAARAAGRWDGDQALRFAAATVLAELEALLATCELACPRCRPAAGPPGEAAETDVAALEYAFEWLGARIAGRLGELARACGTGEADAAIADLVGAGTAGRARDRLRGTLDGRVRS